MITELKAEYYISPTEQIAPGQPGQTKQSTLLGVFSCQPPLELRIIKCR